MAKEQVIGLIDATTPVGSIFTMEGDEQYELASHGSGPSVEIGGVGEADELAGVYTYDEWNNEYAPFVTEIKYPEEPVNVHNPLDWTEEPEGNGFYAESKAWSSTEGGLCWRVTKRTDGKWEVGDSDLELIGEDGPAAFFDTPEAGQVFCEKADTAQLLKNLAEAAPGPEDLPDRPNPHEDPEFFAYQPYGVPAATMEAIEEARDEFKNAETAYDSLNDQAKAAKKDMEHAQEALNAAIDAMLDGELIREDGWPKDSPLAAVADEVPAGDDGWKNVELADLNEPFIKVGVLKVLAENGIHTMGQLAEWQAEKGDFWAKDLKGLGKAACDSISDATDAYWTRNPRLVEDEPFAPPAEETPTEGDTAQ